MFSMIQGNTNGIMENHCTRPRKLLDLFTVHARFVGTRRDRMVAVTSATIAGVTAHHWNFPFGGTTLPLKCFWMVVRGARQALIL